MRLSIITVSHNSAGTIERTIQAVADQNCPDLEYIVVDGGSVDATVEIIKRHHDLGHVSAYISEKDAGISDAFNKGIALSRGDIIGIINSDDCYLPGILNRALQVYGDKGGHFILHGNMIQARKGKQTRIRPRPFPQVWKYIDSPFNHPAMFVPRHVYKDVGSYNTSYRYAMDYDFYVRAMRAGVEFYFLDADFSLFSAEGASGRAPRDCHREVLRSQLENGLCAPLCYLTFSAKIVVNYVKQAYLRQ